MNEFINKRERKPFILMSFTCSISKTKGNVQFTRGSMAPR